VRALATQAGMSRSAFALRFKELMGQAPLEYLTQWRMRKAGRLLREDSRKLLEVATAVGYDSGGAFHKAFKRVLGVTPGEYRRAARV
jgi:AraC-like DNA-binding protein